jgi:hypothetical protein
MTSEEIKTMSAEKVAKHLTEYNKWCRRAGKHGETGTKLPYTSYDLIALVDRAVELLKGMGNDKIHSESVKYALQWFNEYYESWDETESDSLEYLQELLPEYKASFASDEDVNKFRIIKRTIKEEVVYCD